MRSETVTNDYDAWVLINTIRLHFRNKRDVDGMLYKSFPVEKFNEAGNPFGLDCLVENGVTLNECYAWSDMIAAVLRGFLASPVEEQARLLLLGGAQWKIAEGE